MVCDDGSLYYENDPGCCAKGAGIFLDENGVRVSNATVNLWTSYPPVSPGGTERYTVYPSTFTTTSSSTSTSATTTTASSVTSSTLATEARQSEAPSNTAPAPGSPSPSESSNSIGLKVGLALGIPLVALISGIAVYLLMRRHKRNGKHTTANNNSNNGVAETFMYQYVEGYKEPMPIVQTAPAEIYTYPLQEGRSELEAPNREQEFMGSTTRAVERRFSFENLVRG